MSSFCRSSWLEEHDEPGALSPRSAKELIRANGIGVGPGTIRAIRTASTARIDTFHEALQPEFKVYQGQVLANARVLAAGLVGYGLRLVSGGTDNHLMLVDLGAVGISGREAESWPDEAGITANKNAIPYDPQPPSVASGIRVGTPSVTTQGMGEGDMKEIAGLIARAVRDEDGSQAADIRTGVDALVGAHPAYPR